VEEKSPPILPPGGPHGERILKGHLRPHTVVVGRLNLEYIGFRQQEGGQVGEVSRHLIRLRRPLAAISNESSLVSHCPLVCQAQLCVDVRVLDRYAAFIRQTIISVDNGRRQRFLSVKVVSISCQLTWRAVIDGAVIGHPHRAVERDLISNESVSPR